MPRRLSRRDFLKVSLLGMFMAACRKIFSPTAPASLREIPPTVSPSSTSTLASTSTNVVGTSPVPTQALPQITSTIPNLPVPAFIIDGHEDISWNALEFGRDPRQSAFKVREQERGTPVPGLVGGRTTGLPEYLVGRVGIIFATLFVLPLANAYPGYRAVTYATPSQAEARAKEQIAYYRQLATDEPHFRVIDSQAGLEEVVSSWLQPSPAKEPLVGLVFLMEGADPIINPDALEEWYQDGLRMLGLAWHATRYSAGTGSPGPLTDLGRQLLLAMAERNMVLDLSHLAEEAFREAVDSYAGPMIASHSNPHKFLPTDRGLSDDMIRQLIGRDGVVGINLYDRFLKPGWQEGNQRKLVPLETVAAAIDYVTQLAGSARHVAIGTDFDGGFGLNAIPDGMDSVADLVKLIPLLDKRGYKREDIENVMNGNWLRILHRALA